MRPIRRRFSWMLCSWLVFQLLAIATPVALAAVESSLTEVVCACAGSVHGASCPMHSEEPQSTDDGRCVLQSAGGPTNILPLSPPGGAGIIPQPPTVDVHAIQTAVYVVTVDPLTRTDLPDSPPPRS